MNKLGGSYLVFYFIGIGFLLLVPAIIGTFVLFPTRGITPLGYAAFAFALGITAGSLIQRTVPAMATTLAAFALVQIAWPIWVRPHLTPPAHR